MRKRTYDMVELIAGIAWKIAKAVLGKMKGGKRDDSKRTSKKK